MTIESTAIAIFGPDDIIQCKDPAASAAFWRAHALAK